MLFASEFVPDPKSVASCTRSLAWDAVIATRNRPEALALSIPLLLAQSRPPEQLIIVDSSDDPAPVQAVVRAAIVGFPGRVHILKSAPGLPHQRNVGLKYVTAPVVVFPDDDSLFYPDTAEIMLTVYARDSGHAIAGVCASEAMVPPDGVLPSSTYQMSSAHQREAGMRRLRHRLEGHVSALKPALSLGRALNAQHPVPDWLSEMDVIPVEYMTGFRMSFRTDAIRTVGFDEALGGYALDEDVDASFSAMRAGLVVGARRAKIYHHRFPGGRGDAFQRGRMEVGNRAYVLLKHAMGPCGSPALSRLIWRRHLMFTLLKILLLLPSCFGSQGRSRMAGAFAGHRSGCQFRTAAKSEHPTWPPRPLIH